MQNNTKANSLNIDIDGFSEKFSKYGDPKKTLIITAFFIVFVALFVTSLILHQKNEGKTAEYLKSFPSSTNFYLDANLNLLKNKELALLTGNKVGSLSDLLNVFLLKNYDASSAKKIQVLMEEVIDNSFSFGIWDDITSNGIQKRTLAIFPVKKPSQIKLLFEAISKKDLRITTFKGYNINYSSKNRWAFFVIKNRLYLADSVDSAKYIIKNNVLKHSSNLYRNVDVRNSLKYIKKDRIATIILPRTGNETYFINTTLDRFGLGFAKQRLNQLVNTFGGSVISVIPEGKTLSFNAFTSVYSSKIYDITLQNAFKTILNNRPYNNFDINFLPLNTDAFIYINNPKSYFDLMLLLDGSFQGYNYSQLKQLVKTFMPDELQNGVSKFLSGNILLASINIKNAIKPHYVLIINNDSNKKELDAYLTNVFKKHISTSKTGKVFYKGHSLMLASGQQLPVQICYGSFNNDTFIIGDKFAIQSLIDNLHSQNSKLINNKDFKIVQNNALHDTKFSVYTNFEKLNSSDDFVNHNDFIKSLNVIVKESFLSVTAQNDVIKTTLTLNLK